MLTILYLDAKVTQELGLSVIASMCNHNHLILLILSITLQKSVSRIRVREWKIIQTFPSNFTISEIS